MVLGWSNDIDPSSSNEFVIVAGKNNIYKGGNNHYVLGIENTLGGTHENETMNDTNMFGSLTTGYNNYGVMSSSIITGRNHRTQNFQGTKLENNILGGDNNFINNNSKNSLIIGQNHNTHPNSTMSNSIVAGSGNDQLNGNNVREDSIIAGRGFEGWIKRGLVVGDQHSYGDYGENNIIFGAQTNNSNTDKVLNNCLIGGLQNTVANQDHTKSSMVVGMSNTLNGDSSAAIGFNNNVKGDYCAAIGFSNNISGDKNQTIAIGGANTNNAADDIKQVILGFNNEGSTVDDNIVILGHRTKPDNVVNNCALVVGAAEGAGRPNVAFQVQKSLTRTEGDPNYYANIYMTDLQDYANDSAAASAGVGIGGLYHTSGTVKIRTS